ncbi:MAG: hypothetical protein M3021_11865, partial [Actinomycetota bacterium]|nr:hypothetical protein [Actinomycetota bacterium]
LTPGVPPAGVACLAGLVGALAGAGAGIAAGLGQARVLRSRVPQPGRWIGATAGSWALAGLLGYYGVVLLSWQFVAQDLVGAALFLGGALVGGMQGWFGGWDVRGLGWWTSANALGAVLGWTIARAVWGDAPLMDATGGLLGWAGFLVPVSVAGISGLVSGLVLLARLTRSPGDRARASKW